MQRALGPGCGMAGGVPGSGARCVANVAVWYLLLRGFPSTNPLLRGRQNRRVVSENLNKENLVCAVCLQSRSFQSRETL